MIRPGPIGGYPGLRCQLQKGSAELHLFNVRRRCPRRRGKVIPTAKRDRWVCVDCRMHVKPVEADWLNKLEIRFDKQLPYRREP